MRRMQRHALQARGARRQAQRRAGGRRQLDPRRVDLDGGPGPHAPASAAASGPRPMAPPAGWARLPAAGPARDDPLGGRGAAPEDRARARAGEWQPQARPQALHPRRAHDRPAPGRRAHAVSRTRPPRRRGPHRAHDRAPSGRNQARGLGHRSRPRRRRRGRARGRRGNPGGGSARGRLSHAPLSHGPGMSAAPARLPDRLTARRADLTLALASLVWGVSFVVVKAALAASTPLAFTALRFAIATLALAPFARLGSPFAPPELKAGALLGALLAVGFAVQAVGLVFTTPARSAFIVASSSVLAPVVAFVAVRERPRPWGIAALGVAGTRVDLLAGAPTSAPNRGAPWTPLTPPCSRGAAV